MKRLGMLLVLVAVSMFVIGCDTGKKTEKKPETKPAAGAAGAPAAPAAPAGDKKEDKH